ncbi:MAG TPA: SGNH/GDSL hydrolase family protein [Candidatus Krumholzibacteria bacterium]|nr:SGNH/GDSL hydrolase family protein [Candidatus Krumholzibacteria bacterium]
MLLNLVVLLVFVNAALYVVFKVKDTRTARRVIALHKSPSLRTVYPGMTADDVTQLLRETWSRSYAYEPFTQFKERPYHGRFVNVDDAGFRLTRDQGPWPPDRTNYNIFLFGGSTTFGYGVPDSNTVASYLQADLRANGTRQVCVYNFGRSSYVSTQERVLLEELLIGGFVPDMALFVDGLNEFAFPAGPAETQRLAAVFGSQPSHSRWRCLDPLPMTRLAHYFRRAAVTAVKGHEQPLPQNVEPTAAFDDGKYHDPEIIAGVIARYFANREIIQAVATANHIRAVFVWQPIPLYKYDLHYHLFATSDFGTNFFARYGYRYMEDRVRDQPPGNDFLWCADIQEHLHEPLYVDKVHYTARMSALLADTIAIGIRDRGLIAH